MDMSSLLLRSIRCWDFCCAISLVVLTSSAFRELNVAFRVGGAERGGVREREEEAEEEDAEEEEEPVQHTYTHRRGEEEEEERDTARLQCRRQRAGVCVEERRHKTSNTYLFPPSSWPRVAAFFLPVPGCGCLSRSKTNSWRA